MKPSELRRRGVIYVTMVMTFAVRALSVFLTVWLTAAAAFPPCCWSMASAHAHQPTADRAPGAGTSAGHHHDHHGRGDANTAAGTVSVVSAVPADDCDAEFADAATTMGAVKRAALRPAPQSAAAFVLPAVSGPDVASPDSSPPGASFTSAFLSPLRI